MATLREEAKAFTPKQTKNIADMEIVSLDYPMQDREGLGQDGKPFSYKVILLGESEYRVPNSVLNDIKTIMAAKPTLKNVKVVKKGTGMNTEYTVIPLD